ncbi:MAG: phosphoserine transaminase [Hyphomicrobium sp.]
MKQNAKPAQKPINPRFSSGPCAKRPGWTPQALSGALTGRSHRSAEGRVRLANVIHRTKDMLRLPKGYEVAIVPASDTGAFEMAMWNLLGPRGVDVFAWEIFGRIWLKDAVEQLAIKDLRIFEAGWGHLPDMAKADFSRDVLFTWNGTTTGVAVPNADWISATREGLTFCDATSAVFAQPIDFSKIDVLTYSWQKVLGGEAAHGMLILSPRALSRLETYAPPWPMPKIFRLKDQGKILHDVFEGVTINTPSMLCVEDYADALSWAESLGGLDGLIARAQENAGVIYRFAAGTDWLEPLAADPKTRSNTSVCLRLIDPALVRQSDGAREAFIGDMAALLEHEGVAYDIAAYRGVPPGLRIWTGATVETSDLEILTHWLNWAHREVKARGNTKK